MVRHLRVFSRLFATSSPRTFFRLRNVILMAMITVTIWFFKPQKLAFTLRLILPNERHVNTSSATVGFQYTSASLINSYNSSKSTPASSTVGLTDGGYLTQRPPVIGTGQGNLMFMYASLMGIADHKKMTPVYPGDGHLRKIFQISTRSLTPKENFAVSEAKACSFDTNLVSASNRLSNITVVGYLQSWKYFGAIDDKIRREFTFNENLRSEAQEFLGNISLVNGAVIKTKESLFIGVHIRRRDMLANYNVVRGYTVATKEYLNSSVNHFRQQFSNKTLIYVVCSDDPVWSRENFPSAKDNSSIVAFSENRNAAQDMAILAACNHSIITVGTFGWWSGYLAGGRTIYYKNFPAPGTHIDNILNKNDYFPPAWIGF